MSINTLEKRASASNIFLTTVLPVPDGEISAADRIQVGGEYSGIAAAIPTYPENTIRERIISALATRAANIRTANGFNTECGATIYRAKKKVDPSQLPFISIWPGEEEKSMIYGKIVCEMPVIIESHIEHTAQDLVSHMLSDLIENFTGPDWSLPFYLGSNEIEAGDTITGATSNATAYVYAVSLTSGSWTGGDAAGILYLRRRTGEFQFENLKVGDTVSAVTIWPAQVTSHIYNSTNNLAESIDCVEGGTRSYPDDDNLSIGASADFLIRYSYNAGDPYCNG